MTALTAEYENKIKADCEQLYTVLKNCDASDQAARDAESIKTLYRLVHLLSYRQGSKLMAITTTTASYLCHHPMLPVLLVEILRDGKHIKVCAYALDVLAKLVLKNAAVGEPERRTIRRLFHEPHHFRTVVAALRNMDTRFPPLDQAEADDDDADTIRAHDMQVRFLKIINCMYSRKGQAQIALITDFTVEFLGRHFVKHALSNREISRCMLPLIKTICRNRKNCMLMCDEAFVQTFVAVVQAVNRYPAGISILRFLSRSPEALEAMSRVEALYHFVVQTANHHAEKSTHRKYLMGAMYRLAKTSYGMQLLKNTSLWSSLLEYFMKSERLEELRQRMSFTRAYTILHRGVPNKFVVPMALYIDFEFSREIQTYICDRANHHSSDDSDDEEDDEEEQRNARSRTVSAEQEEDDNDESDNEIEDDAEAETETEDNTDNKTKPEEPPEEEIAEKDIEECRTLDAIDMKPFYAELTGCLQEKTFKSTIFESEINRCPIVDRLALPDFLPHIESHDDGFLSTQTNIYSPELLKEKLQLMKYHMTELSKVVYDLDTLMYHHPLGTDVVIPKLEDVHMGYLNRQENKMADDTGLKFESRFECGNLRRVEQIGDYEYNLFISPDANMTCGLQWFYFQVSGMRAHRTYAFNIVNLQKCNSQFSYGLQPVMFSALNYALHSQGWRKCGSQLMYYGNEYISRECNKQFRTLRFCITFDYDDDVCYFAYHFPYTYTRLMRVALALFRMPPDGVHARVEELTKTVGGLNAVPLITVTSGSSEEGTAMEERKLVFLTSRVHPGESNASWIIEGAMRYLLSDDAYARRARERYIFKIVPCLNPEGVIYGNTRCGLTGDDLNRCWRKPHPRLHPEIYNAKKLVQYAAEHLKHEVFAFVDIHGHSRKKHCFLYGCNARQSWNETDAILADAAEPESYNSLPKAMAGINANMKLAYCRNTIERKRETTCRVVMWREFAIQRSHTLECSFCSGENKRKITTGMLREVGESIIKALADLAPPQEMAQPI